MYIKLVIKLFQCLSDPFDIGSDSSGIGFDISYISYDLILYRGSVTLEQYNILFEVSQPRLVDSVRSSGFIEPG